MQLVHTRMRLLPPSTLALTAWRLGFQRRRVVLCAWEMLFPNCGPLPQSSHFCAMSCSNLFAAESPADRVFWKTWGGGGRHERIRTADLYRVKVAL